MTNLGYSQFWRVKVSSMPLSETTSMPLSCAEPGEEAVQLPHPFTPSTKPASVAPSVSLNPVPLQSEMNSHKPSATTPCSDTVPSKPASAPRFRLELPQFSTFARKERNNANSGNTSGRATSLLFSSALWFKL